MSLIWTVDPSAKNLPVALPYVEKALGGTSNEVNSVNLVYTRPRLALDLISTLAGILREQRISNRIEFLAG